MFRFTLRDLFWLTLVVGLVCAWLVQSWRLSITQDRFGTIDAELVSRNCTVDIDNDGLWIGYPLDGSSP